MPFFSGEYELTIDLKNRLLIPAKIRNSLDAKTDATCLVITVKGSIPWLYPRGFYKYLLNMQIAPTLAPDEPHQDYTHLNVALVKELEWDDQGHVVLPPTILSRVTLSKEVTLIGSIDHLELWSREEWNKRRDHLIASSRKIENWALETLPQLGPVKPKESAEAGKP